MWLKFSALQFLFACLLTAALSTSAWAVTITKPVPPTGAQITAVTDGPTCPNSIAGHYATAQGTNYTYVWTVTPSGAANLDTTIHPKNHTIRFMTNRSWARQNNYQYFTLTVQDLGDLSTHTITIYPISMDFVKTAPGSGGTTLRTYTRYDADRVVHAPKDRDDPDSDNTRAFEVEVIGQTGVLDMEFVTWSMVKGAPPNQTVGMGRLAITEYNGSSQNVAPAGCTPHPNLTTPVRNVYRITTTVPSSWNPAAPPGTVEGTVHTFTLKGDAMSNFWQDIEIDVGIRQYPGRIYCADGVGDSMKYTVPKIDIELDTMSETEEGTDANETNDTASAYLLLDKEGTEISDLEVTIRKVLPEEDLPSGVYQVGTAAVDANGADTTRVSLANSSHAAESLPLIRSANSQLEYMGYAVPESKSAAREDTRLRVRLESSGTEVGGDSCRDSAFLTVLEGDVKCPKRESGGSITTPHTSSTDGNEFTFDSSSPGTLTIEWKMAVSPDTVKIRGEIDGLLQFGMVDVGDSDRQWSDGALAYASGQWEFSGDFETLPTSNSGFGKKGTQVTLKSDFSAYRSCEVKRDIEVFYLGTDNDKNHPGAGSGTTPNWYYYWMQSSHVPGGATFRFQTSGINETVWDAASSSWVVNLVGGDGHPNGTYTPPEGDNGGVALHGIDILMWTLRHEARHVTTATGWFPSGDDPSIDVDGDNMKDTAESAAGGTAAAPVNGGPFYIPSTAPSGVNPYDSDGDGYWDDEDYTMHTQSPWTVGSADGDDWAKNGKNW